ncbi:hypothetical protein [Chryseobacterium sp. JK1]|uniref:hypothetical protein n=1 Tax=Chryseobacterium sp. JK1 TaxID=874294 RepID=UPI003D68DE5C
MPSIGYTNIKVIDMISGNYSKYFFAQQNAIASNFIPSFILEDRNMAQYFYTMGILEKKEDYSPSNQLLQKSEITYQYKEVSLDVTASGESVKKVVISKQLSNLENYISTSKKLNSTSENIFEDQYSTLSYSKETLPDGTVIEKNFKYPQDKGIQKLINANMVETVVESTTSKNGKLTGKSEVKFEDLSHFYPTSIIAYDLQTQLPITVNTMDMYDSKGNLVQTTSKEGIPVTTIWGYYQSLPIAVISGAAYTQVSSLPSVAAVIAASNSDYDNPATEPVLLSALEVMRKDPAMQNYTITGTTHDPLVGVTNTVSSNGIRATNVYDNANRLVKITDVSGKVLKEYQYNYKH